MGVRFVRFQALGDDRGRFFETFRKQWFPERSWEIVQTNRSDSRAGVLRGLHYHFRQVDYWHVVRGAIRVGLADLRQDSPTVGASEALEIGEANEMGVFHSLRVAHGFYALTDATLTYIVDNYYDGADELGVAWDDPDLAVPWHVKSPILSPRDQQNPRWKAITEDKRP
ncbi:MAG: dTDP-4-dehydrorhamnose 3,5-epimerase family protein [Anaerolineales bacterium]|nr:dTDP-4-dehydrorhamnose 3,5-epimerase family protein [Anaerolineales bacterium]